MSGDKPLRRGVALKSYVDGGLLKKVCGRRWGACAWLENVVRGRQSPTPALGCKARRHGHGAARPAEQSNNAVQKQAQHARVGRSD